jgi:hypothetical protein
METQVMEANKANARTARLEGASSDLVFSRRVERLHRLGPRPLGEILIELIARWGEPLRADLDQRLDRYLRLDPAVVHALGGDQFPAPPLHAVEARP